MLCHTHTLLVFDEHILHFLDFGKTLCFPRQLVDAKEVTQIRGWASVLILQEILASLLVHLGLKVCMFNACRDLNGKKFPLELSILTDVQQVKEKIASYHEIPVDQQILRVDGRVLDDDDPLIGIATTNTVIQINAVLEGTVTVFIRQFPSHPSPVIRIVSCKPGHEL